MHFSEFRGSNSSPPHLLALFRPECYCQSEQKLTLGALTLICCVLCRFKAWGRPFSNCIHLESLHNSEQLTGAPRSRKDGGAREDLQVFSINIKCQKQFLYSMCWWKVRHHFRKARKVCLELLPNWNSHSGNHVCHSRGLQKPKCCHLHP